MEPQNFLLGGLASVLMGAILGVFGAGGSILTVPLLVFLFHFPPMKATHHSLLVVGVVSGFGVIMEIWKTKSRAGTASSGSIYLFAISVLAGMFLVRSIVLPALPGFIPVPGLGVISLESLVLFSFAIFMILASLSMLFLKISAEPAVSAGSLKKKAGLVSTGVLIGGFTGFVGAGGGFLIVPALVFLARLPLADAIRSSLFVITLSSLWGFFISLRGSGAVPWGTLSLVIFAALMGMAFGLKARSAMDADKLKPLFGVFVAAMGFYILWRAF